MDKPIHILLVDDDRKDIELTLDALREAKLENSIEVARGGAEALDYLFGRGKFQDRNSFPQADIILLDLKMPGADGQEVLKLIKSTPVLKRIPVIILTTSKEEADRALSYENGANSYLVKPVTFEAFLEVIKDIGKYWLTLNVGPPTEPSDGGQK